MNLIQYTINWTKGEIFEATLFGAFGFLIIIIAAIYWKFGTTPNAKAMVIPLLVVGLFFAAMGVFGVLNNQKRIPQYEKAYEQNPSKFVQSEKQRVEDFQYLYTMTIIIASVSFAIAIGFFFLSSNHLLKAIGIALILFGLTGLGIDYFSKERADIYYKEIKKELENYH
jgi:hypothetical protein